MAYYFKVVCLISIVCLSSVSTPALHPLTIIDSLIDNRLQSTELTNYSLSFHVPISRLNESQEYKFVVTQQKAKYVLVICKVRNLQKSSQCSPLRFGVLRRRTPQNSAIFFDPFECSFDDKNGTITYELVDLKNESELLLAYDKLENTCNNNFDKIIEVYLIVTVSMLSSGQCPKSCFWKITMTNTNKTLCTDGIADNEAAFINSIDGISLDRLCSASNETNDDLEEKKWDYGKIIAILTVTMFFLVAFVCIYVLLYKTKCCTESPSEILHNHNTRTQQNTNGTEEQTEETPMVEKEGDNHNDRLDEEQNLMTESENPGGSNDETDAWNNQESTRIESQLKAVGKDVMNIQSTGGHNETTMDKPLKYFLSKGNENSVFPESLEGLVIRSYEQYGTTRIISRNSLFTTAEQTSGSTWSTINSVPYVCNNEFVFMLKLIKFDEFKHGIQLILLDHNYLNNRLSFPVNISLSVKYKQKNYNFIYYCKYCAEYFAPIPNNFNNLNEIINLSVDNLFIENINIFTDPLEKCKSCPQLSQNLTSTLPKFNTKQ